MIDQPFRAKLDSLSEIISKVYLALRLRPNHITLLAFALGIGAAVMVGSGHSDLALVIWWISRFFDGTDGLYARYIQQTTRFGAYLDILLDMAAYSAMIIGFEILHPQFALEWSLVIVLYVLCITSALSLGQLESEELSANAACLTPTRLDNRGAKLAAGLAEGGETGLVYTSFILLPAFIHPLLIFWIFILTVTVLARSLVAWRQLKS